MEKEDFFSILREKCPSDKEIERTKKVIKLFSVENGEQLTEFYCKSDVIFLVDIFEKFIKVSIKKFVIIPLYCFSLPAYTWQCCLKYTNIELQTPQDKELVLTLEINIREGISSLMGDR